MKTQQQRIAEAEAMVAKWQRKLNLAITKLNQYQRKLIRAKTAKPVAPKKGKAERAFDLTQ